MNSKNLAITKLINSALDITAQAEELEGEISPQEWPTGPSTTPQPRVFECLTMPINEAFWSQDKSLIALLDYLNETLIPYDFKALDLRLKGLFSFNSAQQYSCQTALLDGPVLNNYARQQRRQGVNIKAIEKALQLSIKIELLLKSIERALKRGVPCN
jgi:hypothetical protein